MRIKLAQLLERLKTFYHDHEPACTAGFFAAGFLFDILAVGRIDRLHNVIHQATYLSLCAFFTGLELRERYGRFTPPERLKTAWRYHVGVTHFMLGTLLNIYTLFYFKSASLGVSLAFLLFLVAILAVNEMKPFESSGVLLRMSLFSLCLVSYFTYLVPMLVGRLGTLPFLGSLAGAVGVHSRPYLVALHGPARPEAGGAQARRLSLRVYSRSVRRPLFREDHPAGAAVTFRNRRLSPSGPRRRPLQAEHDAFALEVLAARRPVLPGPARGRRLLLGGGFCARQFQGAAAGALVL